MPVRFKDTAEYRQRFSPQATQTVLKNSSKASDVAPSGSHPLVSILKTSILPSDVHQTESHSDEYVLLGDQSKFAPSVRYRLRPTATVHRTTPQQQHADSSTTSLHGIQDVKVRGQSSSQGHNDVEGSLLIGHGINRRSSQGCQSNAGDIERATRDTKMKKKLISPDEKLLSGGNIVDEEVRGQEDHHLGQTYSVTQSQLQSARTRYSSKENQQQPLESHQHHHHHHHQRNDGERLISKDDPSRLHQATQTTDSSHHRLISQEKSNEESQARRRRRRMEAKDPEDWLQNKENVHSHSAENQPISKHDCSYHRDSNNSSSSATTQKRLPSYHEEKRWQKSKGQRDPSAERHRDRGRGAEAEVQRGPFADGQRVRDKRIETEIEGQRDPSVERHRDRGRGTEGQRDASAERHKARDEERGGRETELQSLRVRTKNHSNNHNRTQHNAKEMKPKKDTRGISVTSGSSASLSSYTLPPPHRHHQQQQQHHLVPKKGSSRDQFPSADNAKNISRSTGKTLEREKGKRDGKTLSEDRLSLSEKRKHSERSLTDAKCSLRASNSRERSASAAGEEDKRATAAAQCQLAANKATAPQSTSRPRYKGRQRSSGIISKAEHDCHASVTKKDEIIQTDLTTTEVQRMNLRRTREDESHQQPKSSVVSPLSNHSEYQRQFQWRRPMPDAFIQQQQQQQRPITRLQRRSVISLSHPDFSTLFASDSANKDEDTEYRFQFRPISARNDRRSDRGNLAQQLNQLRRGQSLRDLATVRRNEESNETTTSVVRHHDNQPRKYRSEYMRNFQPPWNYEYEDGTWKELEKGRRNISQAVGDDGTEVDSSSLFRSSSSASSWYEEVLQLRRHAEEYRRRAHGTHFSREQLLEQLYARNIDLREAVVSNAAVLQDDDSRRRKDALSAAGDSTVGRKVGQMEEQRTEDEKKRRRKRREHGKIEERTMDGRASVGRPLRHHFDRASRQHQRHRERRQSVSVSSDKDAYDDSDESSDATEADVTRETRFHRRGSVDERRRRTVDRVASTTGNQRNEERQKSLSALSSADGFRSTDRKLLENSTGSVLSEAMRDNRTKKTAAETGSGSTGDKSVQINFGGATAFQSNRQQIISSSSLASQVLERARNRNDKFWSK